MHIDPRLNEVDDCLYRVAVRVLIIQDERVLLVREHDGWWSPPGGGVDHDETIESTLTREVEEELGVPAGQVFSDFQIAYYNIGNVVSGVPRMNIFFKATVPEKLLQKTAEVAEWNWFTEEEFLELSLNASYNKADLAGVIFSG